MLPLLSLPWLDPGAPPLRPRTVPPQGNSQQFGTDRPLSTVSPRSRRPPKSTRASLLLPPHCGRLSRPRTTADPRYALVPPTGRGSARHCIGRAVGGHHWNTSKQRGLHVLGARSRQASTGPLLLAFPEAVEFLGLTERHLRHLVNVNERRIPVRGLAGASISKPTS
jgi:hypothetical protein